MSAGGRDGLAIDGIKPLDGAGEPRCISEHLGRGVRTFSQGVIAALRVGWRGGNFGTED